MSQSDLHPNIDKVIQNQFVTFGHVEIAHIYMELGVMVPDETSDKT